MTTTEKMKLPKMVRDLRVKNRYRQREVAAAIGIAGSSYGNLESLNRITCRIDKIERLALFYQLDDAQTAELIAAYRELPVDAFQKRKLERLNEIRSKASKSRRFDGVRQSLINMFGLLLVTAPDPDSLCICEPGRAETCEVCEALSELGLDPWVDAATTTAQLAALQEAPADTQGSA
jgi:transcriptional regulator with XRE-family HTH domain